MNHWLVHEDCIYYEISYVCLWFRHSLVRIILLKKSWSQSQSHWLVTIAVCPDDVGHDVIMTTQLHDPPANWLVSFSDLTHWLWNDIHSGEKFLDTYKSSIFTKCFILGKFKVYYVKQVNVLFILIPNLKELVDK